MSSPWSSSSTPATCCGRPRPSRRASNHDAEGSGPAAAVAVAPPPPPLDEVLTAWRAKDLVVVIAPSRHRIAPGRERAYRLRILGGEVTGEDVGDAAAAQRWAETLFAEPDHEEAARALGSMIVPAAVPGAPDGELLHVLAIGPLGKVPLAALRDAEGLIIARRPVARVLALRAAGAAAHGAGPPVVIADPRGDLPAAAEEGKAVAEVLGTAAQLAGSAAPVRATRDRLWAARDAELLHVAAHVTHRGPQRALRLADGDVEPAELVRARLAPRLAVLAGCGSAAATDEEGWGSLAAALLEAGTTAVLATDRSVGDAASLAVVRAFYAQSGRGTAPAHALARVQRALHARAVSSADPSTSPRTWAAFSVLVRPPVVYDDVGP